MPDEERADPPAVGAPHGEPESGAWRRIPAIGKLSRDYIVAQLSSVSDLMPVLMKQRNGKPWTADERRRLHARLRRLAHLSPYLLILLLPGSVVLLPLYAWWLDRRRKRRICDRQAHSSQG